MNEILAHGFVVKNYYVSMRHFFSEIGHLYRKAKVSFKQEGLSGVTRGFLRYKNFMRTASAERKRVHLRSSSYAYDFVRLYDPAKPAFVPVPLDPEKKLTINWIIPDFSIGSGGHMTIFRMIQFLEKQGHTNRIYIFDGITGVSFRSGREASNIINQHFLEIEASVHIGTDHMLESDVIFATSWHTAYPTYAAQNTKQKFYFVQDFEPDFYAVGAERVFAEQTYSMGFKCVTAGPWLSQKMREEYNAPARHFWLAYDRKFYAPTSNKRKKNTIAFYSRFVTARRGFELGVLALKIIKKRRPDVDIVFFGWDTKSQKIDFEYTEKGVLNHEELASLYNEATVGLLFSMTNYSLLPQEMMACGLPVVEFNGGNTRAVFSDGENILLADPNPYAIADAVIDLLQNEEKRKDIASGGQEWVKQFSWEDSGSIVETALYEL